MDGGYTSNRNESGGYAGGRGGSTGPGTRGRGFRGTSENAKTRICQRWLQGECRFGANCNFAHGEAELRTLPPREGRGRGRGYGGYGRGGGRYPQQAGVMGCARKHVDNDHLGQGSKPFGPQEANLGNTGGYASGYGAGYGGGYGAGGDQRGAGQQTDQDVWAASGYPTNGPNGWVMYKVKETGEPYYHNHRTNVTQWERPADWPAGV